MPKRKRPGLADIDQSLLLAVGGLLLLGLIMLASSSVNFSTIKYNSPWTMFFDQSIVVVCGLGMAWAMVVYLSIEQCERYAGVLFLFSVFLLVLVLIPGIGKEVNGSRRWLVIGFQPSELMKLTLILFFARFIARYLSELREQLWGALKPLGFLLVIGGLLLMEPDYGALGVMLVVALGMLFLCGVRLWQFLIFTLLVSAAMSWLIIQAPYRLTRLLSFIDPWDDPFSTDYQLSQALIAIGRGDWWGVGLGNGIQKLAYLPDAHTDFMFAILSEELGFAGAVSVIFLFVWVLVRIFTMANQAMALQKPFAAFLAYGIGMWISIQMFINIGVNLGLLPTKGLTLPWMSYGRSSLLVMCIVLGLLLRIDYENSQPKKRRYGARKGSG